MLSQIPEFFIEDITPPLDMANSEVLIQIKKERICSNGNYGAEGLGCYDLRELLTKLIDEIRTTIIFELESYKPYEPYEDPFRVEME